MIRVATLKFYLLYSVRTRPANQIVTFTYIFIFIFFVFCQQPRMEVDVPNDNDSPISNDSNSNDVSGLSYDVIDSDEPLITCNLPRRLP